MSYVGSVPLDTADHRWAGADLDVKVELIR
jgi:hypothetical protein